MTTENQAQLPEKAELAPPTPILQETEKVLLAATQEAFDTVEKRANELIGIYEKVVWEKLDTTKGMKAATDARAELRTLRTGVVDKLHAAIKAPLLAVGRLADTRKTEIGDRLKAAEKIVDDEIKAEEARKAAAKAMEMKRVAAIRERISTIQFLPTTLVGKTSAEMRASLEALKDPASIPDDFAELLPEAQAFYASCRQSIETLIAAAEAHEAEQKRLQDEKERLAAEQLKQQQEAQRLEAEARQRQAELDQQEAELRRQQDELEAKRLAAETPAPVETPAPEPTPAETTPVVQELAAVTSAPKAEVREYVRPSNEEILMAVAERFNAPESVAYDWLMEFPSHNKKVA